MSRLCIAALIVAMCVLCASAALMPKGTVLTSSGASSLTLFPPSNGKIMLQAVLGPCTGLQVHTHSEMEIAMAAKSNKAPIKMVYFDASGKAVSADVKPGSTFEIPASLIHYQYNSHCEAAAFFATLKSDASTQLVLSTLENISPKDFALYATTKAAKAKMGFYGTDPVCMKNCMMSG